MWDDQAADIDDDIQGNSTSDLPPSNVMPMAEDLEEELVSRKANAVTICFLTILLKWFCRYNIGINAINTLLIILHFYFLILKQFSPLLPQYHSSFLNLCEAYKIFCVLIEIVL